MSSRYFRAVVTLLLEVEDTETAHAAALDAVGEILRPSAQDFAGPGSALVTWQYAGDTVECTDDVGDLPPVGDRYDYNIPEVTS